MRMVTHFTAEDYGRDIYKYINGILYPKFVEKDKLALRRRRKFFLVWEGPKGGAGMSWS